ESPASVGEKSFSRGSGSAPHSRARARVVNWYSSSRNGSSRNGGGYLTDGTPTSSPLPVRSRPPPTTARDSPNARSPPPPLPAPPLPGDGPAVASGARSPFDVHARFVGGPGLHGLRPGLVLRDHGLENDEGQAGGMIRFELRVVQGELPGPLPHGMGEGKTK